MNEHEIYQYNTVNMVNIHEECKNQCRSSIILQRIELYPHSLEVVDEGGFLPLHLLLDNESSTIDIALMMIEKYPAALRQQSSNGQLPLHIECRNQRRSSIITKCIELYPEALAMVDEAYLPLHWLFWSESSSSEDALMMIEKYPAALQHQNECDFLPIHVECIHQCRSTIISKCIELYPDSLSKADGDGDMCLHMLLGNGSSSIEDALMMMEKYPLALQHPNTDGEVPLHIECWNQGRLPVISKCIELYPESLAVAQEEQRYLPLHWLLSNGPPSIEAVLLIIDKYPTAVERRSRHGALPIHIECEKQCRSSIISKCIELFPGSLAAADRQKYMPLHRLLSNKSSSVDVALKMIEKYPGAVKYRLGNGDFPIHIECKSQCRLDIVRICIHYYRESLAPTGGANTPLDIVVKRILEVDLDSGNQYELIPILSFLANSNPSYYVKIIFDLQTDTANLSFHQNDFNRRLLLNVVPAQMLNALTPALREAHDDLNWKPRSSLIFLLLEIRNSFANGQSLEECISRLRTSRQSIGMVSNTMDDVAILLYGMIKRSSLVNADVQRFAVSQRNELGDHFLRHAFSYL
jgi:ankyrin repeat protein